MKSSAAQRAAQLRREIERHNRLYYVEAAPELSDREFDALMDELKALERDHPELVAPDSPTQRVGGQPLDGFQRVKHRAPMLSLEKKESLHELQLFEKEIRKKLPAFTPDYIVEPKVDGVSIALHYENGVFHQGVTRGDGEFGDDITANLRTVRGIPLRLAGGKTPPRHLEIRGEAYMKESDRIALNDKLRARGEKTFANTRNATAGALKNLDPRIVAERPIRAVFYGLGHVEGADFATHAEELEALRAFGLPTPARWIRAAGIEAAEAAALAMKAAEDVFPYEIDGFVIKVNDNGAARALGLKTNVPAYAVAYKRPEWFHEARTRLERIVVQVGRTGVLTPVAEVAPVFLDGTTISRITLYNADEIERKDIRIGDTVVIKRAGRVIPAIVRVADDARTGAETRFHMPSQCPACGHKVSRRRLSDDASEEAALRCENPECPAQLARQIEYFASRGALNIEGLGETVADKLVERGMVRSVFDLFTLKEPDLADLNLGTDEEPRKFGAKNARRVMDALASAREAPLDRWLFALGLPGVGETIAIKLAGAHRTFEELVKSPWLARIVELAELQEQVTELNPNSRRNKVRRPDERETLEMEHRKAQQRAKDLAEAIRQAGMDGIGPAIARELLNFLKGPEGKRIRDALNHLGISPQGTASDRSSASGPFAGKTVVVTGSLQHFTRDEAKAALRRAGANVADSVSRKTDFLVVGTDAGSKLDKAKALGVPILNEAEFREKLEP